MQNESTVVIYAQRLDTLQHSLAVVHFTVRREAEKCFEACTCPPPVSASPQGVNLTQQLVVSGWSVSEVSRAAEQTGFASILGGVIPCCFILGQLLWPTLL